MQTPAETSFWTFITRVQALADDPGTAASYAESYLAAHARNFPIVEGNTAHFIQQVTTFSFDYTTVLNIIALLGAAILVYLNRRHPMMMSHEGHGEHNMSM